MTAASNVNPHTYHPASAPDYVPVSQMRQLQFARLQTVVRRAWDHLALFRERLTARGVSHSGLSEPLCRKVAGEG